MTARSTIAREQVRREQLDELIGVAPQVGAALDAQPRGARLEQVARVDGAQVVVALRVECHLREDADAQAELDVGLDHVGVDARVSTTFGLRPRFSKAFCTSERLAKAKS